MSFSISSSHTCNHISQHVEIGLSACEHKPLSFFSEPLTGTWDLTLKAAFCSSDTFKKMAYYCKKMSFILFKGLCISLWHFSPCFLIHRCWHKERVSDVSPSGEKSLFPHHICQIKSRKCDNVVIYEILCVDVQGLCELLRRVAYCKMTLTFKSFQ